MDRRTFIAGGTIAGIGITALSTMAILSKDTNDTPDYFFELDEITIDELQVKMKSGELTSHAITKKYLKRIEELDKKGPKINAVIELNPDALAIADKMDNERKAGKIRSALHGIPVLIKDNIDTGDKMKTTAGSMALIDNMASKDAFIVEKLREAGAVLLGKTNLSEFANFRSTNSTSGWSSRGGLTKNPYALNRNTSGSSSGSGAAVAANLCAVAIGTETDGSIIAPSSFCGIVGMKPTVGWLSRSGIIPISASQDTAGPMARTVKDAALLLQVLIGTDANDQATLTDKTGAETNFTKYLNVHALQGKRIGIETSVLKGKVEVVNLYNKAKEVFTKLGATIIETDLLGATAQLGEFEWNMLQFEFKDGLNKYLANSSCKLKSLAEIIEFNKKNESTIMPYFKQEILELSQLKGSLDEKEYKETLVKLATTRQIISDLMAKENLDAICSISIGLANCTDLVNGDYNTGFYFGSPAAMAGFPHITVPMGKVHKLPVGLSFMAGAWNDAELLGFAYAYEQTTKNREIPEFIASI